MTDKEKHVTQLRENARKWGLKAPQSFWDVPVCKLADAYNGAGPDSWYEWARDIMSFLLRRFREAVLIHDWQFENSDGDYGTWELVNDEMYDNMMLICDAKYSHWWSWPIKRFWQRKAYLTAEALDTDVCYQAWLQAYNNKTK
jgi:hypothetical protein